jgi:hypothetical protein
LKGYEGDGGGGGETTNEEGVEKESDIWNDADDLMQKNGKMQNYIW